MDTAGCRRLDVLLSPIPLCIYTDTHTYRPASIFAAIPSHHARTLLSAPAPRPWFGRTHLPNLWRLMYTDRCCVVCTMRPPRRSLPSIIHLARTVSLTRVFSLLSCYPLDLLCLYPYIPAPSSASGNYFHFRGELYITPSSSVSSSSTRDPSVSCSHDSLMLLSPRRTEHRLVSSTATVYS